MDDQNQNNQPLDQGSVPVDPIVPSVPLDITPQNTPPAVTPPVLPEPPAALPPIEVAPAAPWINPLPAPETPPVAVEQTPPPTPVDQPTTTFTASISTPVPLPSAPTATPVETPMPQGKPKNKIMPIVGGVVALLLVVGMAGAAYYVSNQLSTRQAVAPNAPSSKPLAASDCTTIGADCTLGVNGEQRGTCVWGPISGEKNCLVDEIYCSLCPGGGKWMPATKGCNTWVAEGCGGTDPTQPPTTSLTCARDGNADPATSCSVSRENSTVACPARVGNINFRYECGTECCNNNLEFECCCTGCFPKGTDCNLHTCPTVTQTCPAAETCPTTCHAATTTVPNGSCGTTTCPGNAPAAETCPTTCDAESTTVPNGSCGTTTCPATGDCTECAVKYFCNTSNYTCQATTGQFENTSPYLKCNSTDTPVPNCATSLANDTANPDTGVCYLTQSECQTNCVATTVPACLLINIYKKSGTSYGTTPLSLVELQTLKVGDVLKFTLTSNTDSLNGVFKVTLNNTTPTILNGVIDATDKKLVKYENFTVATAGTYKFEAQIITP